MREEGEAIESKGGEGRERGGNYIYRAMLVKI